MDKQWHSTGLFTAGALAGGIVILAAYLGWFGPKASERDAPPPALAAVPAPTPVISPPAAPQKVALTGTCPGQPLSAARGESDGRFQLQPVLASSSHSDPGAFLAVAREAAEQGRVHDAEVALLAACHVAEQASGPESAPVADAKSHLGQHYVLLAAQEEGEGARDGLLQRASSLFSESATAYAAALGRNASKTRMAEERLASVRSPETLRAALRTQPAAPSTATLGAARAESPPPVRMPAPALVRSDPDLAQLENDLRRLHAQAATVSRDPQGMSRRDAQAIAQRDAACSDKACLLRWYAQRRAQLLDEF